MPKQNSADQDFRASNGCLLHGRCAIAQCLLDLAGELVDLRVQVLHHGLWHQFAGGTVDFF